MIMQAQWWDKQSDFGEDPSKDMWTWMGSKTQRNQRILSRTSQDAQSSVTGIYNWYTGAV